MIRTTWWFQKVHISWFITTFCIGLLIGVALAAIFEYRIEIVPVLIAVLSVGSIVLTTRRRYLLLVMLLVGLLCGFLRGNTVDVALQQYESFYGKTVVISGTVYEDISFGPKGDQRLRLNHISIGGTRLSGTAWISLSESTSIKRGDKVSVSGLLNEGFGTMSATMYRAKVETITRPSPGDIGRRARDWFAAGIYKTLSKEDGDFALAFLLGQKLELSEDVAEQLRTIGLIHVVVASGYHLTILVGVVRRFFTNVSKYLTLLFSYGMITSFILITGLSPSMTRAGIVSALGLLAWYYGRRFHPVVLLSVSAAVTVIYNPSYIWGDLGWYLSFTSFIGVLLLAPLLETYFFGDKPRSFLREIILITIAAQLLTLPLTIAAFGYYSIYAVLANVLVVPIVPLIMLVTFLTGVFSLFLAPFAYVLGVFLSGLLDYVVVVVGWIAGLPSAKTEMQLGAYFVGISYGLLVLTMIVLQRKTRYDFRSSQVDKHLF